MRRRKKVNDDFTLELKLVEVKKRNKDLDPEFVDMFIDVIYRMVVEMLEEEDEEKRVQKTEKKNQRNTK